MSPLSGQPVHAPADTTADTGLRCPRCDYNLTGLTENRCPECGEAVYLARLRRVLSGKHEPIPGWDDQPSDRLLAPFSRMCLTIWLQPSVFARQCPWRCSHRSVRQFRLLCQSIAVGLLFVTIPIARIVVTPTRRTLSVIILIEAAAGLLAAASICEAALRRLLAAFATPRIAPDWALSPSAASWRGFVALHTSFLIITAGILGLIGNAAAAVNGLTDRRILCGLVAACALNLVWWWYCLATGVAVRAMPTVGRRLATILIPAVAVGSIVVGILAAVITRLLLAFVSDCYDKIMLWS